MTVVRRAVHIVGLIQLAARKLRRHRVIMAHRLNEARVLQRIRRGALVLREEDRGQNSQHECNATEIQPDPLPWISLWMKYRMDLKGHVEIMQHPRPDGDGCHIRKHAFQIHPILHPEGYPWQWIWLDFGCIAFMLGVLSTVFLAKYRSAAPYPLKDPRLIEAMGHYHPVPTQLSGGELDQTDDMHGAPDHGHSH